MAAWLDRSLHPELSSQESNPLQSCTAFLRTIQRLLRIILFVCRLTSAMTFYELVLNNRFANSSSTQTEHLLRLTGQLLSGLSDYPSPPLTPLLDLLNDFDRGWVALLKGQQWTPTGDAVYAPSLSSVSMTHKIRLRGLVSEFQRVVFELSRPGQQPSEDEEEEDGGRLNEESDSDESDFEQVTPVQRPLAQEEEEVHRAVVMPRTMARLQEDIDGVGQG